MSEMKRVLRVRDGLAITVGIVIGAGILRTPGLIAPPTVQHASLLGFALAYQSVAFAYYGWEDAAKMAEEIRDPGRSLPRILIGGVVVVAVSTCWSTRPTLRPSRRTRWRAPNSSHVTPCRASSATPPPPSWSSPVS